MTPETIEVAAETLGWSRRRALRVELDALRRVRADLGIIAVGARLDAVLRGGVVRLMDLGARDSVFAPFFGVQAATITGLSRIARLAGAAIVPCVTRQNSSPVAGS